MELKEYAKVARGFSFTKDADYGRQLLHASMGLVGKLSEVQTALVDYFDILDTLEIDSQEATARQIHVREEKILSKLGDLLWYCTEMYRALVSLNKAPDLKIRKPSHFVEYFGEDEDFEKFINRKPPSHFEKFIKCKPGHFAEYFGEDADFEKFIKASNHVSYPSLASLRYPTLASLRDAMNLIGKIDLPYLGHSLDVVKKHYIYGRSLSPGNVNQFIFDIEYTYGGIESILKVFNTHTNRNVTLSDLMEANIKKLQERYNESILVTALTAPLLQSGEGEISAV